MASTFKTIFDKYRLNPGEARTKSQTWFNNQVKELGKPKASQLMRTAPERNRGKPFIGNMYFFYYNAKHRATLPLWDKFPLTIPFSILSDGFIGINLHYLPIGARIYLLDQLLSLHNQKVEDMNSLKITWEKIKAISKLQMAEQCVHRYLYGYLASPLKMIEPPQWETALTLPVQQFVNSAGNRIKPSHVWGR